VNPVTVFFACPGGIVLVVFVLFMIEAIDPDWDRKLGEFIDKQQRRK